MSNLYTRSLKLIKNEYVILSLIILFGFLVRLYKINNPLADWHSWRQADTASVTRRYIDEGINLLYTKYDDISSIQTGLFNPVGYRNVEFPVFNFFHAVLLRIFGRFSLEVWGRILSIFSSLGSVVVIFLIGNKFVGSSGGLLAAFFFAFLPFNIYFSRVILPEPMTVFFSLTSVYIYTKFIDTDSRIYLYVSGLFLAIALLLKPYIIFYTIPLIYLTIKKYGFKQITKDFKLLLSFLIFVDIVFVPFFLWRAWINQHPEGIPFWTWAFNGDHIRFRPAFWRWIFSERLGNLILGIWGLTPFSFGLLKIRKTLFNHFFLFGMFLYVAVVATASVRHDYYQIFTIPAISLTLASGTVFMWQAKNLNKYFSRLILIFSLVLMLGTSLYQVKEFYKINHPEIIEAGNALDKIAPKDVLVIAPYNGDTAFLYQTKRHGWPAVDDSFENIIKKGASFYVTVNQGDSDTKYVVDHYKVVEKTDKYLIADLRQKIK